MRRQQIVNRSKNVRKMSRIFNTVCFFGVICLTFNECELNELSLNQLAPSEFVKNTRGLGRAGREHKNQKVDLSVMSYEPFT